VNCNCTLQAGHWVPSLPPQFRITGFTACDGELLLEFDSTLGYPGEGPPKSRKQVARRPVDLITLNRDVELPICRMFQSGNCRFGDRCKFHHESKYEDPPPPEITCADDVAAITELFGEDEPEKVLVELDGLVHIDGCTSFVVDGRAVGPDGQVYMNFVPAGARLLATRIDEGLYQLGGKNHCVALSPYMRTVLPVVDVKYASVHVSAFDEQNVVVYRPLLKMMEIKFNATKSLEEVRRAITAVAGTQYPGVEKAIVFATIELFCRQKFNWQASNLNSPLQVAMAQTERLKIGPTGVRGLIAEVNTHNHERAQQVMLAPFSVVGGGAIAIDWKKQPAQTYPSLPRGEFGDYFRWLASESRGGAFLAKTLEMKFQTAREVDFRWYSCPVGFSFFGARRFVVWDKCVETLQSGCSRLFSGTLDDVVLRHIQIEQTKPLWESVNPTILEACGLASFPTRAVFGKFAKTEIPIGVVAPDQQRLCDVYTEVTQKQRFYRPTLTLGTGLLSTFVAGVFAYIALKAATYQVCEAVVTPVATWLFAQVGIVAPGWAPVLDAQLSWLYDWLTNPDVYFEPKLVCQDAVAYFQFTGYLCCSLVPTFLVAAYSRTAAMLVFANAVHLKRKLRLAAAWNVVSRGVDLQRAVKHVTLSVKREFAKPLGDVAKAARVFGAFGDTATLAGAYLVDVWKTLENQSVSIHREGCKYTFVAVVKPTPAYMAHVCRLIVEAFEGTEEHVVFLYHSDDMTIVGRQCGQPVLIDSDISACDAHNGPAIFALTAHELAAFGNLTETIALVEQCCSKCRAVNPENPREYLVFEPNGPFEYSGTSLTTILNNRASTLIAASVVSCLQPGVKLRKEVVEIAATRVGHRVKAEERSDLTGLQFLKHSPLMTDLGVRVWSKNLGAIFKKFGVYEGDFQAAQVGVAAQAFRLMTQAEKTRMFVGGVVRGLKNEPAHCVLQALRERFPQTHTKTFLDDAVNFGARTRGTVLSSELCKRYGVDEHVLDSFCELLLTGQLGDEHVHPLLTSVFALDYNL